MGGAQQLGGAQQSVGVGGGLQLGGLQKSTQGTGLQLGAGVGLQLGKHSHPSAAVSQSTGGGLQLGTAGNTSGGLQLGSQAAVKPLGNIYNLCVCYMYV